MTAPGGRLDRARRDALRFARDARRLARRHRRPLGAARIEVDAGAGAVEQAAAAGDPDQLSAALRELDRLWELHLAPRVRPAWRELLGVVAAAAAVALLARAAIVDTSRVHSSSMEPGLLPGDVLLVGRAAYELRLPFTRVRLAELGAPRRGDVIVFEGPRQPGTDYVKRVVGVPGDVVELREQVLHVNGVPQPRTPAGDYAVAEEGQAAGAPGASICRRYREALAKGVLTPPEEEGGADAQARWDAAAADGVASYDVLQCRRVRLAAREGPFDVVQPGHVFVLGDNRDQSADSRGLGGWQVPQDHIRGRVSRILFSWGEGGWSPHGAAGLRLDRLFKALATR